MSFLILANNSRSKESKKNPEHGATLTHPTVTCTTIAMSNNVFEGFKIFSSLDMKQKGVPDFRPIIS